jgi:hypothetical protein
MKIFVPRLPKSVTAGELRTLSRSLLEKRLRFPLCRAPRLVSCEIMKVTDGNGVTDHHGLLDVRPDSAGKWLIGRLRGQRLGNKLLVAREYVIREGDQGSPVGQERRRSNLEVSKVEGVRVVAEGLSEFHVEHK